MPNRHIHYPNFGTYQAPDLFVNGTGYTGLHCPETIGTNPYFRVKTKLPMNPKKHGGHTHAHLGATSCSDRHVHMHPGVTSRPIEAQGGHVHKVFGNTTFDDGHIHHYETFTSPPIPLPNEYHTHYVEIKTTEDNGHSHIIRGFTEPSKS